MCRKFDEDQGNNYKYALVKILSKGIFAWMFIKGSCGGVHRHEYAHCVATLHSTVTAFSFKVVH
jgi:hypothetical protein